jgi:ribosome-associated protein
MLDDTTRRCSIASKSVESSAGGSKERLASARRFAIDTAQLAADTRCHSVVVLDVTGLSPVCDFFVIATGTSPRQLRSVADDVVDLGREKGFAPLNKPALDGESWILVDCVDVIVHLFAEESRNYYDLDNLWGDAKRVEWHEKAESRR